MTLIALVACATTDTKDGDPVGEPCPGLDCQDALTLTVTDPDTAPVTAFHGWLDAGQGQVTFDCTTQGGCADGVLTLHEFALTLGLRIEDDEMTLAWEGELTPPWEAPYDTEECGHYCWMVDVAVALEPCDDCGTPGG